MKKSKSDTEACLLKRSKKSSRRKKKKKKSGNEKRRREESSSSDFSSDDRSDTKDKQKKKPRTKSRHKNKKTVKTRERNEDSSSEGSSSEEEDKRRTKSRRKRKQNSLKDSDLELGSKKKRRKNWKAAGEESSDNSPTDWDTQMWTDAQLTRRKTTAGLFFFFSLGSTEGSSLRAWFVLHFVLHEPTRAVCSSLAALRSNISSALRYSQAAWRRSWIHHLPYQDSCKLHPHWLITLLSDSVHKLAFFFFFI